VPAHRTASASAAGVSINAVCIVGNESHQTIQPSIEHQIVKICRRSCHSGGSTAHTKTTTHQNVCCASQRPLRLRHKRLVPCMPCCRRVVARDAASHRRHEVARAPPPTTGGSSTSAITGTCHPPTSLTLRNMFRAASLALTNMQSFAVAAYASSWHSPCSLARLCSSNRVPAGTNNTVPRETVAVVSRAAS
jgi:hypothetical protein